MLETGVREVGRMWHSNFPSMYSIERAQVTQARARIVIQFNVR